MSSFSERNGKKKIKMECNSCGNSIIQNHKRIFTFDKEGKTVVYCDNECLLYNDIKQKGTVLEWWWFKGKKPVMGAFKTKEEAIEACNKNNYYWTYGDCLDLVYLVRVPIKNVLVKKKERLIRTNSYRNYTSPLKEGNRLL